MRGSKPGERRGGRQKGTINKVSATMKEAITSVYAALQSGAPEPHGHFIEWAKSEPTEFYKLAAKLLPLQISNDPDAPLVVQVVRFGDSPPPE